MLLTAVFAPLTMRLSQQGIAVRAQPFRARDVVPGAESLMCRIKKGGAHVPGGESGAARDRDARRSHAPQYDHSPLDAGRRLLADHTASLIDCPQQARPLRILATAGGGVAIQTWMLDHVFPGGLGTIARQLAFLDAQGGRPHGFAGTRRDRNVTLYRRPPL